MKLGGGVRLAEERLILVWDVNRRIPGDDLVPLFVVAIFGKHVDIKGYQT